jgi:hypothetical protein
MTYFWRFFKHVFSFKSLSFGIDRRLFSLPKGWKVSVRIWAKHTIDDPAVKLIESIEHVVSARSDFLTNIY